MTRKDEDLNSDSASDLSPTRSRTRFWLLVASGSSGVLVLPVFLGVLPAFFGMVAVAIVVTTVFWQIRAHLPAILLVFVSVLLASVVVTQRLPKLRGDRIEAHEADDLSRKWKASGRFDTNLPIVMHLIFDEMMSPGAMTDDLPGGAEIRESSQQFGQRHSFRMFDSVYSRFFFSGLSIPNMMGPAYRGKTSLAEIFTEGTPERFRDNAYFDDMAARGYRTVVFQTSLMDFCENKSADLCQTFNSFDPGPRGNVGLDPRNQRASLWQTLISAYQPSYTSRAGQAFLSRVYGLKAREVGVIGAADRYDAQRFPEWFDRFARFAVTVPRGTHIFAHFMVPHSPYLLSESCVVSGRFEGGYYLSNYPPAEQDQRRRGFYEDYFAQLRCVQRKLDELMTVLDQSENYRDAVIIIHGDHGSRISSGNILEDYTERDFVDNYATFFAVRAPGVPAGVDCEFVSLAEVFRRYARSGNSPPHTGPPFPVVVRSRAANRRVEAPMPLFGCADRSLSR